jgi:hypothetical protein
VENLFAVSFLILIAIFLSLLFLSGELPFIWALK